MELNVSPDLEAYYCYAIVMLVGALVAAGQIRQRIGELPGIWLIGRTWWLFALYVAIPFALFWLLDRTGAVSDTSFFAAVLVGFGYERIITGGSQPGGATLQAPTGMSQFWTPFTAYADRIAAVVRNQAARKRSRLAEQVISFVAADTARVALLEGLAKRFASNVQSLEDRLRAIDGTSETRGATAAAEARTRELYNRMLALPDAHLLMKDEGVITGMFYWRYVKGLNAIAKIAIVVLVIGVAALQAFLPSEQRVRESLADYYVWPISKTNSTSTDQFRARQELYALMHPKSDASAQTARAGSSSPQEVAAAATKSPPGITDYTTEKLVMLLRQPGLPMERVDLVLQILLENRDTVVGNPRMPQRLAEALRSINVDARTRVHESLKFLVEYCKDAPDPGLMAWPSAKGDATADLERKIRAWRDYWAKPCEARS